MPINKVNSTDTAINKNINSIAVPPKKATINTINQKEVVSIEAAKAIKANNTPQ